MLLTNHAGAFSAQDGLTQGGSAVSLPSCRNGLYLPDSDYSPFVTDVNGLNIGWFIRFGPYPARDRYQAGEDTVGMIRFKPQFNAAGQRTGNYLIAKGRDDDGSDNGIPNEYEALTFNGQSLSMRFDSGWADVIEAYPGTLWVVGNEMDRVDLQDSLYPTTYAQAYHDTYHFIKSIDPTAQIAVGGLVSVSPGRLQYLDIVWDQYLALYGHPLPTDVWTFHSYALPEVAYFDPQIDSAAALALGTDRSLALKDARVQTTSGVIYTDRNLCAQEDVMCIAEVDDVELFKQAVVDMRRWMKDHGQQAKPLILTEWSNLYQLDVIDEFGNQMTYARSAAYLDATVAYLETAADADLGYPYDGYRLVQRWNWFQPNPISPTRVGGSSILFDPAGTITAVGERYSQRIQAQAAAEPGYVDLIVDPIEVSGTLVDQETLTANKEIAVLVRNVGTLVTQEPATIIFRDEEGQSIGVGQIPAGLYGCSVYVGRETNTWYDIPVGTRSFTAEIASVEEPAERRSNNTSQGTVHAGRHGYFLPYTGQATP